jgi:mono/diheme cytochrome c family protein
MDMETEVTSRRPGSVRTRLVNLLFALGLLTMLAAGSARAQTADWRIASDAANLKSPKPPTPALLKSGKAVFASRCQRCHGPEGRGDGPESDPSSPAANLTDGSRAAINSDGVLFYKVWNGRKPMPAFKSELSKEEIWSVVEYVKSLRQPITAP